MHTPAGGLDTLMTASHAQSACTYIPGSSTQTSLACGRLFLRVCGTIWACAERSLSFENYFEISSFLRLRFWSENGERQKVVKCLVCGRRQALDRLKNSIGGHFRKSTQIFFYLCRNHLPSNYLIIQRRRDRHQSPGL